MPITILGIESSCDDTSAAILRDKRVLSNLTAGQQVHEKYGGVVPELASRAHQSNIVPVVDQAIKEAGITLNEIDAIAYTLGPGLLGSLMVGSSFAKGLSIALNKPLIESHHMKAHVLAHFIDDPKQQTPECPFLCLTVSGGHTQLVIVHGPLDFEVIGQTIDDAAGEAFDKAAKIIGLPYPGGPLIDRYAKLGNPDAYVFAKPDVPDLQFSFSGFKTSVLYKTQALQKENPEVFDQKREDLCASIQHTIVDILMHKVKLAIKKTGIKTLALAGGVSANSELRAAFRKLESEGCKVHLPKSEYCTDNAAMIAIHGHFLYEAEQFGKLSNAPKARLHI